MSISTKQNPRQGSEFDIDNLPNRITIFRILLIPIIILAMYVQMTEYWTEHHRTLGWIATWIFVVAGITDFVDGHIARKQKIITIFGSFLDPIADKFLTVSALIMLQGLDRIHVLVVVVLVLREIYITSLRLLASSEGVSVPVSKLGKWKTAIQLIGMPMLMANDILFDFFPTSIVGRVLIYCAAVLSVYSSLTYSYNLVKRIKQMRQERRTKLTTSASTPAPKEDIASSSEEEN